MSGLRCVLFPILFFSAIVSSTANAGICSLLLTAKAYVPASVHSVLYNMYTPEGKVLPFSTEDRAWIASLIQLSSSNLGNAFPGTRITMRMSPYVFETGFHQDDIVLGWNFVHNRGSAIVLHEWAHALFTERLKQDSRLFNFFEQLDHENKEKFEELRAQGRRPSPLSQLGPHNIGQMAMSEVFRMTFPYQELFADLLATLILKDPNAMVKAIEQFDAIRFQQEPDYQPQHDNPNISRGDIIASRGFSNEFNGEEVEKTKFRVYNLDSKSNKKEKYIWIYTDHHRLAGARSVIWSELMNQTADHTVYDVRNMMDLVFRVSLEEVFYRVKRPWLWKLTSQQLRDRFVMRLRQEIKAAATVDKP